MICKCRYRNTAQPTISSRAYRNLTIQRYSLLYKQLVDLLPPPEVDEKKKNDVLEFITKQG